MITALDHFPDVALVADRRRPGGDIVILAVPYTSAAAVVAEYGDALDGKVIIDITNPVSPDLSGLVTPTAVLVRRRSSRASPPAHMS